MIWCCPSLLYASHPAQVPNDSRFKVLCRITMVPGRKSVVSIIKIVKKNSRCCPRCLVLDRDSHSLSSKMIRYGQCMFITTPRHFQRQVFDAHLFQRSPGCDIDQHCRWYCTGIVFCHTHWPQRFTLFSMSPSIPSHKNYLDQPRGNFLSQSFRYFLTSKCSFNTAFLGGF